MLFLMEKADGARFEISGPWLLFYTRQRDAEFLPEAIAFVEEFRSRIPPGVWSLYPVTEPHFESD
jgi:hypothetical protein